VNGKKPKSEQPLDARPIPSIQTRPTLSGGTPRNTRTQVTPGASKMEINDYFLGPKDTTEERDRSVGGVLGGRGDSQKDKLKVVVKGVEHSSHNNAQHISRRF